MDDRHHTFSALFEQLGLPSDDKGIGDFILAHRPLPADIRIEDAPFWNRSQAALLREEICRDADWAELVDQLSVALRHP